MKDDVDKESLPSVVGIKDDINIEDLTQYPTEVNSKASLHDNSASLLPPPAPAAEDDYSSSNASVSNRSGSRGSARRKRKKKAKAKEWDLDRYAMYRDS